jgi:hypothetical protein
VIHKVVQVHCLDSHSEIKQNLEYWLSRPPEERIAAVEELRRQVYGDSHRLRRLARVMTLEEFAADKEAASRGKDSAGIETLGAE